MRIFLNIHFIMSCTILAIDMYPVVLPVGLEAVRLFPSLCSLSLPATFCGKMLTRRIMQFCASQDPKFRVICSNPVTRISWFLTHLDFFIWISFGLISFFSLLLLWSLPWMILEIPCLAVSPIEFFFVVLSVVVVFVVLTLMVLLCL